ncbi:MAG: hypothetical protein AB8H79_17625 [Myxococcota bacterium]
MSDPFESPRTPPPLPTPSDSVDDEVTPRANAWVYLAGISALLCGLFGAGYALQLFLVRFYDWGWMAPYVIGALSIAMLGSGGLVLQARLVANYVLIATAALSELFAVGWFVYSILNTLFSPIGLIWHLLVLPTFILSIAGLWRVRQISSYRRRLLEDL